MGHLFSFDHVPADSQQHHAGKDGNGREVQNPDIERGLFDLNTQTVEEVEAAL